MLEWAPMYIMKYIHMPLDHVLTMAHMSVANSPFKVVPVMFVGLCESHLGIDVSIIYKLLVEEARYKSAVLASAVGGYESDYYAMIFPIWFVYTLILSLNHHFSLFCICFWMSWIPIMIID